MLLFLEKLRVVVRTLSAKTRNPTRARTPINRKRLVNKAEATAAATGKPFIMIRQYWISVTTPTLQYYTITHYDLPLMTFTIAAAHYFINTIAWNMHFK